MLAELQVRGDHKALKKALISIGVRLDLTATKSGDMRYQMARQAIKAKYKAKITERDRELDRLEMLCVASIWGNLNRLVRTFTTPHSFSVIIDYYQLHLHYTNLTNKTTGHISMHFKPEWLKPVEPT